MIGGTYSHGGGIQVKEHAFSRGNVVHDVKIHPQEKPDTITCLTHI